MAELKQIQLLARFLDVDCKTLSVDDSRRELCITIEDGKQLTGLGTLSKYLVQKSKYRNEYLGHSSEEEAILNQWLEFRTTRLNGLDFADLETVLKVLNSYLEDKVYFVGHKLSLADILLYYALHSCLIQYNKEIRQGLEEVKFSKTNLYVGVKSH